MINLLITEASRRDLLDKGKKGDSYVPSNRLKGRNRYERRRHSRIYTNVAQYNNLDMNAFFKKDILIVGIKVIGETDEYITKIKFEGVLEELQREVKNNNDKLEFKNILTALIRVFNSKDVYISCTCIHPDTKIKLLDGTTPTVEEMRERFINGEKLWVYSTDENGDFKPGEVENVWITKNTKEFIKITLDNGEEILTTPDHRYMLRNGEYLEAEELKVGQSLMPIYLNKTNNDYQTVKLNSTNRYNSVYKLVSKELMLDEIEEAKLRVKGDDNMNYDVAVHHKDFNKHNNNPENLQVMTAREHWDYHANLCGKNRPITERMREAGRENAIRRNSNPSEKMLLNQQNFVAKGRAHNYELSDEELEWRQNNMRQVAISQNEVIANMTKEERDAYYNNIYTDEIRTTMSDSHKNLWKNMAEEEYQNRCRINLESNAKSKEKRSSALKEVWNNLTNEQRAERSKNNSLAHIGINKGVPKTEEHKAKMRSIHQNRSEEERAQIVALRQANKIRRIITTIRQNNLEITAESFYNARQNGDPGFNSCMIKYGSVENMLIQLEMSDYNHKVVKVEWVFLEEDVPVYDIAVKNWHNFTVDAGVVVHNCEDWVYRMAYHATKNRYSSGPPEMRPSDITNPHDSKGSGCKHTLLVLANMEWLMKVTSVINNYIKYAKQSMQRLYADYIFPKIYGVEYQKAVQLDLFDTDDFDSSPYTLDDINRLGRKSGQFQPGNPYRFQKQEKPETNPLGLEFAKGDEEETEEETPLINKNEQ